MITITPDTATSTLRCMVVGLELRIARAKSINDAREWRKQVDAIRSELAKRERADQTSAIERQRDAEFRRAVNNTL